MITESPDTLVIRDVPYTGWIVGAAFLGTSMYSFVFHAQLAFRYPFLAAGLLSILLFGGVNTLVADRSTRQIRLTNRFFLIPRVREFDFDEIDSIEVQSSHNSSSTSYRMVLRTTDGEAHPLTLVYSSSKTACQQRASQIRKFIGHTRKKESPPEDAQVK